MADLLNCLSAGDPGSKSLLLPDEILEKLAKAGSGCRLKQVQPPPFECGMHLGDSCKEMKAGEDLEMHAYCTNQPAIKPPVDWLEFKWTL